MQGAAVIEFVRCDPAVPPATDLLAAVLADYDAAGRPLRGGPSATAMDFSPPRGLYIVGRLENVAVCGGGVKRFADDVAEIKRMYVVPAFRRRGFAHALLKALEDSARDLGYARVRLDSESATWPLYAKAGYTAIPDYNENPDAEVWGEKLLP